VKKVGQSWPALNVDTGTSRESRGKNNGEEEEERKILKMVTYNCCSQGGTGWPREHPELAAEEKT